MERKGQAALEFLMTYGWAILAAIIVIGVLVIYFNPGRLGGGGAPIVSAPFYAVAVDISSTGVLQFEVRNNGGETLNDVNVTMTATQPSGTDCGNPFAIGQMTPGQKNVTTFTCTPTPSSGALFRADVTIGYNRQDSSIRLTSTGTVSDTVP